MTGRYRFDDVLIDLQGFRLVKAGKVAPVEPKALNLLIFLVEHRARLVERRELIDAVWGDAFVTDHVLNRRTNEDMAAKMQIPRRLVSRAFLCSAGCGGHRRGLQETRGV